MNNNGRHWSRQDEGFILLNWRELSDAQMAERLGRTTYATKDRRIQLGKIRPAIYPAEGLWSEGKVLKSAQEYVDSLGDMPTPDKVWMIERRIEEIRMCRDNLRANDHPRWVRTFVAQRALAKMLKMSKELKDMRDRVAVSPYLNSEIA